MKRSEMVNLIAEYLENEFGSISYNSSNKNNGYEQIASELLTNLESEGMQPPKPRSAHTDNPIFSELNNYIKLLYKWEPEDET